LAGIAAHRATRSANAMLELQVAVRNQEEARYYATADSNAGVAHKNKKIQGAITIYSI